MPDALIVPDSWFDDWYQRVSLYFFDPTSEVLVPEPVFVPRGDQLASSLVRGLLTPASGEDQDVSRTYFPPGTAHGLSVPIEDGIAEVSLSGDPDAVDEETAERMLAQLVWTLRQEPRIRAVQLSVGGRVFDGAGGSGQVNLGYGSEYDPNGSRPSTDMFALDQGRVVSGAIGDFAETLGPLGADDYGVRAISRQRLRLAGGRCLRPAAATSSSLRSRRRTARSGDRDQRRGRPGRPRLGLPRPRVGARPRGGRARVSVVVDGVPSVVRVPGLSGRTVTQLLVSRDGSRLVAVVRDAKADRVVAARIRHDAAGAVLGFTPLRTLPLPPEGSPRIRDVGWRSPTSVSVLSDINEDFSQVRTFSVDGAPGEIDTGDTTRSRDRIRSLVSSPVDATEVFALAGRTVISLTRPERSVPDLPQGLRSLTYAG